MSLWSSVFIPEPPYFPALLLETGFHLLLESGDHFILE